MMRRGSGRTRSPNASLPSFQTLRGPSRNGWPPEIILAIDPGETTGWALFIQGELTDSGQALTKTVADFGDWFEEATASFQGRVVIVAEDYRIYAHKLAEHTFSSVHTLRILGALELLCHASSFPLVYQMAYQAKTFVDNRKLEHWGMLVKGRHARDAVRHAAYYLTVSSHARRARG